MQTPIKKYNITSDRFSGESEVDCCHGYWILRLMVKLTVNRDFVKKGRFGGLLGKSHFSIERASQIAGKAGTGKSPPFLWRYLHVQ